MSEVRQRWRLVFARREAARYLAHLDAVKLWERAFRRGRIPIAVSEGFSPRPRLVFAAPLPLGMLAEQELADLYLAERLTLPDLRDRLRRDLPLGYELVDLHDVWVGEPSLASQLAAADYRVHVSGASLDAVRPAAAALLGAERLDREKKREDRSVAYDLRPLLLHLDVRGSSGDEVATLPRNEGDVASGDGLVLEMRLRHAQEGVARAEEVVLALSDALGQTLEIEQAIRLRLWLTGELESGSRSA